jgi:predicted outer membrane lipoprotein
MMTLMDWLIGIGVAAAFVVALLWLIEIEARKISRADAAMKRHVNREDQGD